MLREAEAVSRCPDTGSLDSPQTRFETTAKPTPEPWLIDNVAALTHARLASRSAYEEFGSRDSELPPDKLLMVEQ
jgi:hypothetical protein